MTTTLKMKQSVEVIIGRLNTQLGVYDLAPVEAYESDINIYKRTVEIAIQTKAGILLLETPQYYLEDHRNLLDAHLGKFVALNRDAFSKTGDDKMADDTDKREVVSPFELAVNELVFDMQTRQGFKQLWGAGMEDDVKEEMKEEWRRILSKIIGTTLPGLKARHCIITDNCRRVQGGDIQAIDEALRRVREMMVQSIPNWPLDHDHRFHLYFTVERGAKEPKGT